MAVLHVFAGAGETPSFPAVRKITLSDLRDALARGIADFWAMPSHLIFVSIIYPLVGLVLARLTLGADVLPLLFPLAAGFALIGPFAAIGLYELSRRKEQGLEVTWKDAFQVVHSRSLDAILALGGVLAVIFLLWLAVAQSLYQSLFGYGAPASVGAFLHDVFATREGWTLIIAGNAIGLVFAIVALMISVVSFPLLLERDIGALMAMHTSVRAVLANPLVMAVWGLIVAVALALGSLPLFVGLAVVMPVLAHASWHLYRKLVVP